MNGVPSAFWLFLRGFGEVKHQWLLLVTQGEQSHTLINKGKIHFSNSPKNFFFRSCVFILSCSCITLQHRTEDWLFGEEMACTYGSYFLRISSSLLRVDVSCCKYSPGDIIFFEACGSSTVGFQPTDELKWKMNAKLSVWPRVIRWNGVDWMLFLQTGCRLGGV